MSGKILVIVESPGKISKIQKILGNNYKVIASVGHIIDLPSKEMGVNINNKFTPIYKPINGKSKVISNIRSEYKRSSDIIIATDEDREGEMIAWSIAHILKIDDPKRIVFNSITKTDITKAVKTPGHINIDIVQAQKSRRISDRLVGFELSPLVNKYLSTHKLSAGRVQSVVVMVIIEREDEIDKFYKEGQDSYFKFKSEFKYLDTVLHAVLHDTNTDKATTMKDKKDVKNLLNKYNKALFKVNDIKDKISKRNPQPPFTTATLQQEANRKIGLTSRNTMMSAQRLYEAGYITYMRTDSVNLSAEALKAIEKYIIKEYGKKYHKRHTYKNKGMSQEAHEAIRPTNPMRQYIKKGGKINDIDIKLYSLIWKRAVASQMQPAEYNVKDIYVTTDKDDDHYFLSRDEILKFQGYLLVYGIELGKEGKVLPNIGDNLLLGYIEAKTEFNRSPGRYNEASLINKLSPKNLDIGRPSTYASIISKILDRGYVEKKDVEGEKKPICILRLENKKITEKEDETILGSAKNVFVSTPTGRMVNDFLVKNFSDIMDYKFTARMESDLDKIANGRMIWYEMLDKFYKKFHPKVKLLNKQNISIKDKYARTLGCDPDTKEDIVAYIGQYGPVLMKKRVGAKAMYAPIKAPLKLETITLEQALKVFEYPKILGKYKRKNVLLKKGKYGLYIEHGKIRATVDEEVTLEKAIKLIDSKGPIKEISNDTSTYKILEGPYGKYIKVQPKKKGNKSFNVSIPKGTDINNLNKDNIQKFIDNNKKKYKKRYVKK